VSGFSRTVDFSRTIEQPYCGTARRRAQVHVVLRRAEILVSGHFPDSDFMTA
jgi:hypothetical protein